jgi:hypothetical protein
MKKSLIHPSFSALLKVEIDKQLGGHSDIWKVALNFRNSWNETNGANTVFADNSELLELMMEIYARSTDPVMVDLRTAYNKFRSERKKENNAAQTIKTLRDDLYKVNQVSKKFIDTVSRFKAATQEADQPSWAVQCLAEVQEQLLEAIRAAEDNLNK